MYCNARCARFKYNSTEVVCKRFGRFPIESAAWVEESAVMEFCGSYIPDTRFDLDDTLGLIISGKPRNVK